MVKLPGSPKPQPRRGPPLPRIFQKQFRAQLKQQQSVFKQEPVSQQAFKSNIELEKEAYISQYGNKVGFEIFQLAQLEKELENIKGNTGMGKRESELRMAIGEARLNVRSAQISSSIAPAKFLSGPGIDTTITKKSGEKIILTSSKEGQKYELIEKKGFETPQPFLIDGKRVTAPLSTLQGTGFVTESGKIVVGVQSKQQFASYEPPPVQYETKGFVTQAQASKILGQDYSTVGFQQAERIKIPIVKIEKMVPFSKDVPKETFPTFDLGRDLQIVQGNTAQFLRTKTIFGDPRLVRGSRIVIQKTSEANKFAEQTIGNFGSGLFQSGLDLEIGEYRKRYKNPELYYFQTNFPRKEKDFLTIPQIKEEARLKLLEIEKPEFRVATGEIGAQGALTLQYYVNPQYTVLKTVAGGASDIQEGRSDAGAASIASALLLYGGTRLASKGIGLVTQKFSNTYQIPYGSGYKDIITEKFISRSIGTRNQLITGKLVPSFEKLFERSSQAYILGSVALESADIYSRAYKGESAESIRRDTVISSRETGYFLTTTQTLSGIDKASQVFRELSKARAQLKKEIPFAELEAPDVRSGKTIYPKDTQLAKEYLRKIKKDTLNPSSLKNKYFDKKFFKNQSTAFTVSPRSFAEKTYVRPGSSELAGGYLNPFNPSFTFGLIKTVSGVGGYRFGYQIPKGGGPAQAIAVYGKDVTLFPVGKGGFDVTKNAPKGEFLIPTKGKFRVKSESEVLLAPSTKLIKVDSRYYTVETNLSRKRGYPFGSFFEIPEYRVSFYQGKKSGRLVGKTSGATIQDAFRLGPSKREVRLAKNNPYYIPPVETGREAAPRILRQTGGFGKQSFREIPVVKRGTFPNLEKNYTQEGIRKIDTSFGFTRRGEQLLIQELPPKETGLRVKDIIHLGKESQPIRDISTITGKSPKSVVKSLGKLPVEGFTALEKIRRGPGVGALTGPLESGRLGVKIRKLSPQVADKTYEESILVHEFVHGGERIAGITTGRPKSDADYFISPSERRAYAVQERFLESKGRDLPSGILFQTGVKGDTSLISRVSNKSDSINAERLKSLRQQLSDAFRFKSNQSLFRGDNYKAFSKRTVESQKLFQEQLKPRKFEYSGPSSYGELTKSVSASNKRILESRSDFLVSPYRLLKQSGPPIQFGRPVPTRRQPILRSPPRLYYSNPTPQEYYSPPNKTTTTGGGEYNPVTYDPPSFTSNEPGPSNPPSRTSREFVPPIIRRPIIPPGGSGGPPQIFPPFGGSERRRKTDTDIDRAFRRFSIGYFPVSYRKGKPLKKLSREPLTLSDALAVGSNFVDQTIKRSFKVIRSGGFAEERYFRGPVGILRRGKRDRSLFVELSKFAISTRGEKTSLRVGRQQKLSSLLNRRSLLGRL